MTPKDECYVLPKPGEKYRNAHNGYEYVIVTLARDENEELIVVYDMTVKYAREEGDEPDYPESLPLSEFFKKVQIEVSRFEKVK